LVTKLWNADQGYDSTLAAFDASMQQLGIDYLDLYLVHWPVPGLNKFVDTFKAFAHLRDQGRIRSIGVSNFEPEHLDVLIDATGIVPAVNQVELHPRLPQTELREAHARLGVAIPKSVNPKRIASNFDVFDFELSNNDMASISSLDDGNRLGPNPRTFDFTGR
jgi:2,5-diketo-D-gluconate reductase A